jgi:predicted RND superfamily exporter protein
MTKATSESRFFHNLLQQRKVLLLFVLALTGVLSVFAGRVRPDFSIEMAFPTFDKSRVDYERYKKDFPLDDAQAVVVVEAPDLFSEAGLRRIAAMEDALGRIPGVIDTQGLTTVQDLTLDGESLRMGKLFPRPDLPADELAKRRQTAVSDPLFAWNLAPPDGRATLIMVTLTRAQAATDEARTEFLKNARKVLREQDQLAKQAGVTQRVVLNGLPVIRSEYTELINMDLGLLFPLAFLLVLVLLFVTFRKMSYIGAAVATIMVSVIWTMGVMGIAKVPLQILTQVTPIVVMIISISDTVHIVMHYRHGLTQGLSPHDALAAACQDSAVPCLLTEVTIAGGFLGLIGNDMVMIQQFGLVTAAGMLLTWLANMTVLPLCLSLIRAQPADQTAAAPRSSIAVTQFERFIAWIEKTITNKPKAVLIVAGAISLMAAGMGTRAGKEYFSYDDLRPNNPLARNIRYLETMHGGSVPFAIYIEPKDPAARRSDAMLEPAAVQLIDRITHKLESDFPEDVKTTASLSKYLRKAHRLLAGPEVIEKRGPLPVSRALAVQELLAIDDPRTLRDVLSFDRSTAAVLTMMPDRGSSHATHVIENLSRYFAQEEQNTPYRITLTGIYGIADGIYRSLVGGLVRSLGVAVLISFAIFCLVLRSVRLAAVALIPNLLPLLVTLGLMSLLHIDIKPSTVLIFSVTLVIADDDTIQYLSRFRRAFLSLPTDHPEPHKTAALATLRDTGLPMFTTSCAISLGFLVLLFSQFLGLANLGLLIGVSLLSAVFADLFLSPLLLMKLKPRLR